MEANIWFLKTIFLARSLWKFSVGMTADLIEKTCFMVSFLVCGLRSAMSYSLRTFPSALYASGVLLMYSISVGKSVIDVMK